MFKLFGPSKVSLLGLDISSTSVKIVEISAQGENLTVEGYGELELPENAMDGSVIKDIDAVAHCVRTVISANGLSSKKAVIAVPDSLTISRTIQVHEGMNEGEIEEVVVMEADKNIPYPIEEINLDFNVIGTSAKNSAMQDVLIVATRSEHVSSRVEVISRSGLEPEIVDVESFAVERVARFLSEHSSAKGKSKLTAVIDIGAVYTHFYVLSGRELIFTREEEFGGTQLIQSIMQQYGVKADEARKMFFSGSLPDDFESEVLQPYRELILLQVKRGLQFFFSSSHHTSIDHIILGGGVSKLSGLATLVQEHVNIPTDIANPFKAMTLAGKVNQDKINEEAPMLLVACGLALRASKAYQPAQ